MCSDLKLPIQWIAGQVDLLQLKWISQYLRYPTSLMAEIWPPSIFFQYICTCKVSAQSIMYGKGSSDAKVCMGAPVACDI